MNKFTRKTTTFLAVAMLLSTTQTIAVDAGIVKNEIKEEIVLNHKIEKEVSDIKKKVNEDSVRIDTINNNFKQDVETDEIVNKENINNKSQEETLLEGLVNEEVTNTENIEKEQENNEVINEEYINIPDEIFRKVLNEKLGQEEDAPITKSQLETITSIVYSTDWYSSDNVRIKSLEGIQYCINLTSVSIQHSNIEDVSFLKDLTNIKGLSLVDNKVKDISSLEKLTQLTFLDLDYNDVEDISAIKNFKLLTYLDLDANKIEDISPVAELYDVEYLDLRRNNVKDITAVRNLNKLEYILLESNNIETIDALENLTNLKYVSLSSNKIEDIDPLKNITSISILELGDNKIKDISALENLENINTLELWVNEIEKVDALKNLNTLQSLIVNYNNIEDISMLGNLTNLRTFRITANNISDISVVKNYENLRDICMDKNRISDVSILSELENLTRVECDSQKIIVSSDIIKTDSNIGIINNIKDINGQIIEPMSINNNGTYIADENKVLWSNSYEPLLGYTFENNFSFNNIGIEFTGEVIVNEKPVVTLEYNTITISVGDAFDPEVVAITVTDVEDTEITEREVVIDGEVDINTPGEYLIKYKVADKWGLTGEAELMVTVNSIPVILGANNVELQVGDEFNSLQGITATDAEDGDITEKIVVSGDTVDTTKAGEYKVTYTVTDKNGGSYTKTITVIVKEKSEEVKPTPDEDKDEDKDEDTTVTPDKDEDTTVTPDGDEDTTVTPEEDDDDKVEVNPEEDGNEDTTVTPEEDTTPDKDEEKLPQTGGTNVIYLYALGVLLIIGGVIVFSKKKKQVNKQ